MKKRFCLVLALLASTFAAYGQTCLDGVRMTAPTSRFQIAGETVLDTRTGLTWQRCPTGYDFDDNGTPDTWTDDRCVEAAATAFSWADALQVPVDVNAGDGIAGITDWRLPNIKELLSIVEFGCVAPAINLAVFPDTKAVGAFWSSTSSPGAKVISFYDGVPTSHAADRIKNLNAVRLVR